MGTNAGSNESEPRNDSYEDNMSIKNVYPEISSFEGILQAEKDVRAGKRFTAEKLEFFRNYEDNLHYIVDCLKKHSPPPDSYRYFFVYEPKIRKVIYADYYTKIIQRACYNALNPKLCKGFISETYSCIKERGQLLAMQDLAKWVNYADRHYRKCYYLKMDIEKFFYRMTTRFWSIFLRRR